MEISGGRMLYSSAADGNPWGAFKAFRTASNPNCQFPGNGRAFNALGADFYASRNWAGSTSQPSGANSLFGKSTTVQPASIKIRVKCKAK